MPIYEYNCECGASFDKIFSASSRPDHIDCAACSGTASYKISVSKFTDKCFVPDAKEQKEFTGMTMHQYKCRDCGHTFEEIVDFGEGERPTDVHECPECNSADTKWKPSARIDRFSERFPYFDRGLGVMLQSKAHRLQICKERGLTPVDGDWDVDSHFRKWDDEEEKETKEYAKYCDRLDNDPAFASYREAERQADA